MNTIIFDGRSFASELEKKIKSQAQSKKKLVSILSAVNKASVLYTSLKQKAAERIGIRFEAVPVSSNLRTLGSLSNLVSRLNSDPSVGGILIQLPFFNTEDDLKATALISSEKDVDCLTPFNLGLLQLGRPQILPATVRATLEILATVRPGRGKAKLDKLVKFDQFKSRLSWLTGQNIVVIGSRGMVGAPLVTVLSYLGATVTGCHRKTKNLAEICRRADILISCAGSPRLIKKEMVQPNAAIVDVGTSVVGGKVIGDVDPAVAEVASFVTPVPGGVGPITVALLLQNFIDLTDS